MKAKKARVKPEAVNAALAAKKGPISKFIAHHYRHFNAAALVDAAKGYETHLQAGGKMLVTLAGAMSTAELGISLAEMIRKDKVHAIVCTGANLEEDIFNLVAHDYYERVPHYRHLTAEDEVELVKRHMNRVTDTCIPEMEAMRRIEAVVADEWTKADQAGERYFPHEFMYKIIRGGKLKKSYQIDPKNSWMLAACEKNLPIIVPGWEDATLGNMYAGRCVTGEIKNVHTVRTGIEYMTWLAEWYTATAKKLKNGEGSIGFFQIGGGIAGDFPICVVPMLHQDLQRTGVALGLLCADQRFDHELRQLFRRGAEREDHVGQARGFDAEVHRRERCDDRGAADFQLGVGELRGAAGSDALFAGRGVGPTDAAATTRGRHDATKSGRPAGAGGAAAGRPAPTACSTRRR